jgi:hypothetical protein
MQGLRPGWISMLRHGFSVLAITLALSLATFATDLKIVPTTTLSAQTGNNTSASNAFDNQSNGNSGANNISKVDVHSLLYPGARTKIYAHLELWFGRSDHMNVGYSSTDPKQVKRQVNDMISRGIDGIVMVWYGPNNSIDQAAKLVMNEAELHPGFTFAIMIDHGAILWNSCSGCNPQQALTAQLQYLEQTYFSSPAYLKSNGQPVITNFDIDLFYKIDWPKLKAQLATDPVFIFQNHSGFSHPVSNGAYSWVMPTTTDFGMSYLTDFLKTGKNFPKEEAWGAVYKGFNDTLASWGEHRIMKQQCGQTWLQTFSRINNIHDSTNQLPAMQLVTWNDYEEGTEIESGISNCVKVSASVSGSSLRWNATGDESTVDHYTVYASTDGKNLMPLQDESAGLSSLNLCSYSLPPDNYVFYVQAIGKPNLSNQISGAVQYTPHCGKGPSPKIKVSASPSSLTIDRGSFGTSRIVVLPESGRLKGPLTFSCSNLPANVSCDFSAASMASDSKDAKAILTISTTDSVTAARNKPMEQSSPASYAGMLSFSLAGFVVVGGIGRKRLLRAFAIGSVIGSVLLLSSCALNNKAVSNPSTSQATPGVYHLTITATSPETNASMVTTVTIR